MKTFTCSLLTIVILFVTEGFIQNTGKDRYDLLRELDQKVKIEEIPKTNIVSLNFTGSYQRHPEAYAKLSSYVMNNYVTVGTIIGIYPEDPDLVSEAKLTWKISLRILPKKPQHILNNSGNSDPFAIPATKELLSSPLSQFKTPKKPFTLEQLPPVTAVTLVTDVAHLGKYGLAINAWISMNNYVQTGTTRTEFGSSTAKSAEIPVKIIVPIKKRSRETI